MSAGSEQLRRRATATATFLGTFMCILAVSLFGLTLPAIQTSLKIELADLQWVAGTYTLCLSSIMLSAGPLGDRYGHRKTWLSGVVLFVVGTALCGVAYSLPMLIMGKAVQGAGAAFVIPGALSILSHSFPDPIKRARIIGGWVAISNISLICGPIVGGFLIDNVGWHSVFWAILPLGIVALILGFIGIPSGVSPDRPKLDVAGQILSAIFLGSLTYTVMTSGLISLERPASLLPVTVAVTSLVLFILVQFRVDNPVLPIRLFRNATFSSSIFAAVVVGFAAYPFSIFLSLYMQRVQGWTATETGWCLAPLFAATVVTNFLFGYLAARTSMRALLVAGFILLGGSAVLMALIFTPTTPYAVTLPFFVAFGIGLGLAVPATDIAIMAAAPDSMAGVASATMNALRQSGMTIGIALLGIILEARAISTLAGSLAEANVSSAVSLARTAVKTHSAPGGLSLPIATFDSLLADAYGHGFVAMFILSGACSLIVAALLTISWARGTSLATGTAGARA